MSQFINARRRLERVERFIITALRYRPVARALDDARDAQRGEAAAPALLCVTRRSFLSLSDGVATVRHRRVHLHAVVARFHAVVHAGEEVQVEERL